MVEREQPALSQEEWPEIRRAKASSKTGWTYYSTLVKMLVQEIGEEKTVEILRKVMEVMAKKYVVPTMKMFGIEGTDAWALGSYFKLATGDVLGYRTQLIQETPKRVVLRVFPPCLWFPELDISPNICHAEGNFETTAAQIVNPRIRIYGRALMTSGDPYCEAVFEEVG